MQQAAGFGPPGEPALWLYQANDAVGPGVHVAFRAADRPRSIGSTPMALRLVAAITAVPACAPTTAPNYYAAFLLDPDGNNVEAVCLR